MNEHTAERARGCGKKKQGTAARAKKEPTSRPGAHTASELRELEPENWLLGDRFND